MAQPLAALIVRVLADTSELNTGMQKAVGIMENAERGVDRLGGTFQKVSNLAGLFGKTLGVIQLARFVGDAVEAADALGDLSDKLGDTAEHVQQLQRAAELGDTSITTLGTAIQTLQTNLAGGKIDEPLKQINLTVAELSTLSPVEQYMAVAEALGEVSNQGERLKIAQDLLGKSAKELAATYRGDLAEATKSLLTVSNDTVQGFSALSDAFKGGGANAKAFGIELAGWVTLITPATKILNLLNSEGERFNQWMEARKGAEFAKDIELVAEKLPDWKGVSTRGALPGGGPSAADINAQITSEMAKQVEYQQALATDAVRAMEAREESNKLVEEGNAALRRANEQEAMRLNTLIAQKIQIFEANQARGASTFERMQKASGVNVGEPDQIAQVIARGQAEIEAMGTTATEEKIAETWRTVNIEIAAINQGLGHVVENTKAVGEAATAAAQQFQGMTMGASTYVDPQGNPTTALRSAVLATMPAAATQPFGGDVGAAKLMSAFGGGTVQNTFNIEGFMDSPQSLDALARRVSEALTRTQSMQRTLPGR